jgi:hypothetical protein
MMQNVSEKEIRLKAVMVGKLGQHAPDHEVECAGIQRRKQLAGSPLLELDAQSGQTAAQKRERARHDLEHQKRQGADAQQRLPLATRGFDMFQANCRGEYTRAIWQQEAARPARQPWGTHGGVP